MLWLRRPGPTAWYTAGPVRPRPTGRSPGQMDTAIGLLDNVVGDDRNQLAARSLRAAICRRIGRPAEARADISSVLSLDPLDAMALDQRRRLATEAEWAGEGDVPVRPPVEGPLPGDVQTALDRRPRLFGCRLLGEAIDVLRRQLPELPRSVHPMVRYTLAWLQLRLGDPDAAAEFRQRRLTCPLTTASRHVSRRSRFWGPRWRCGPKMPAPPTTWAISSTTGGDMRTRLPHGGEPPS